MKEIGIQHYQEFETPGEITELAAQLNRLVRNNRQELAKRAINGPFERYGGKAEDGERAIRRGQEQDDPDHFALLNTEGSVIGAASLFRALELKWLPLPLPRQLVPEKMKERIIGSESPNITAWVDARLEDELTLAYSELADLARAEADESSVVHSWTLEPKDSAEFIHGAIEAAGLTRLGSSSRYDDGENFYKRNMAPGRGPARTLYLDEIQITRQ